MKLRAIALIALMSVLTFAANAQATRADSPAPDNFLGIATFPLWDGDAPGALGKEQADVPTITRFRPWPANSNGTAVIIAPGGGYMGLAANHEARQVADWFTSRGVTAFVLKYRLGQKYLYPIPLTDAQRAIRLERALAKEFEGLGPDIVEDIRRIKSHNGPDLILSGSSTLTSTLLEHGLADEVLLLVYPVLLGKGKRFFAEGTPPRAFELASTKALSSGIVTTPTRPLGL